MDNPERVTYFAVTDSRGQRVPFGLKAKDRNRHMYVIGKTGMGKSTLLENMAIQDIRNGEGLAFIDPHGGTADKLLEYVPENRIDDVVYFAPFDLDRPIAFNVMEDVGYDKRHLVTSGLMATFKKIWEDAWSARMEYILTNTLLALLEYPDATLLGVNRMYTDKAYRKKVVDNVKDPVVRSFWIDEFAKYTDKFAAEATPAIQNKIGQFTSNPLIRNIIGQPNSSFDIRDLMDRRKILIINLSKGQVGDVNMRLLGSMLTTRIYLGAMSRADLSHTEVKTLPNFYFYVDEFQNFANDTFAEILSEARKYNLNLTIAHQYVEQMEEQVRAAVFGNVGTTVSFRVGPFDAETLETIFAPKFMKEDLVNLGFAQIYLTLMIDGVGSPAFSAMTLPSIEPPPRNFKKEVIERSRQQFGAPRAEVEKVIFEEIAQTHAQGEGGPVDPPAKPQSDGTENRSQGQVPRREATRPASGKSGGNDRSRPQAPRPQERPADRARSKPPAHTKSAEDLRSILRTMAAKTGKPPKQENGPSPLKGALANVIGTSAAEARPQQAQTPGHKEASRQATPAPKSERKPDAPPTPPKQRSQPTPATHASAPYEVPEETLRALFSEPK
ncbi:MAG TPA: type IV secretion system DNA-binding domain-containing protein [Candidatus Paceibacterota bacterium]|jgi:hypothetical protein